MNDNTEFSMNGIQRFQLFYTEAIMQDSSFPQINKIKPLFEHITLDEFIDLVEKIDQQPFVYISVLNGSLVEILFGKYHMKPPSDM